MLELDKPIHPGGPKVEKLPQDIAIRIHNPRPSTPIAFKIGDETKCFQVLEVHNKINREGFQRDILGYWEKRR